MHQELAGWLSWVPVELRVSLFGRDRITPYALAGFAAGRSGPNVNDIFPTPVVNDVRAPFAGGRLSHRTAEDSPFDVGRSDHWVSAAHTKPVSSRATAVTMCGFGLPRAANRA